MPISCYYLLLYKNSFFYQFKTAVFLTFKDVMKRPRFWIFKIFVCNGLLCCVELIMFVQFLKRGVLT